MSDPRRQQHRARVSPEGRWRGETALHVAAQNQQIDTVRSLLENEADPNARDKAGHTALHLALLAASPREQVVRLLLEHGADVNAVDVIMKTALIYATDTDSLDLVRMLVEAGAQVNHQSVSVVRSCSALFYACRKQNARIVGYLLEHGADASLRGRMDMTALHELALSWCEHRNPQETWRSTVPAAKLLLEHGVPVDARDSENMTALHLAAYNEDEALIRLLLEAGADVNANDNYGNTPLHLLLDKSEDSDRLETITRLLVEYGADLAAQNRKSTTPLLLAVEVDNNKIVNFLLAKISGVDEITLRSEESLQALSELSILNVYSMCELDVAIALGYEHVVDRLIDTGAYYLTYLEVKDHHQHFCASNFYCALKARQFNITKMLLEAGCTFMCGESLFEVLEEAFSDENLESVCLVMEYNIALVRAAYSDEKFLTFTFKSVVSEAEVFAQPIKVSYLLIFYYMIDIHSNNVKPDVATISRTLIENNAKFSTIFFFYDSKLNELKERQICHNLSMYDVLSKSTDWLVNFVGNEENYNALASLPLMNKTELESYEQIIKMRTNLALERRRLLDLAKDNLISALQCVLNKLNYESLPDKIVWNIFKYVNFRELRKMATGKGTVIELPLRGT